MNTSLFKSSQYQFRSSGDPTLLLVALQALGNAEQPPVHPVLDHQLVQSILCNELAIEDSTMNTEWVGR